MKKTIKPRLKELDNMRGVAIILMIIYHFYFDLNYFAYVNINMFNDWFWIIFRYIIISLFLLGVGVSLVLTHKNGIIWHKVWIRFIRLFLAFSAVSIGSYIIFPDSWIYFGILHFIALTSIISLPLLKHPLCALTLAIIIFIIYFYKIVNFYWLFNLLQVPLNLPQQTQDLVPLLPWWSLILIGIWLANAKHNVIFDSSLWCSLPNIKLLTLFSRHSLLIYLIHQPILFALFYLVIFITT